MLADSIRAIQNQNNYKSQITNYKLQITNQYGPGPKHRILQTAVSVQARVTEGLFARL